MSKLAARRFGDRLLVAGDPENPVQVQLSLADLTVAQIDALERFATALVEARQG
jgi:hypothetical protein